MNIEGKDFTNFRNINLRGTGNNAPVVRFQLPSATVGAAASNAWDSTLTIVPISGSNVGSTAGSVENPYLSIAGAGLNIGTGYIRFVPFGGSTSGTISVNTSYNDTDRAWTLPSKSGTLPIAGTFSVDLPAISANSYLSTAVTITGLRVEDGIIVSPQSITANAVQSARGALVITNAVPTANTLTVMFWNPTATATIAVTGGIVGYVAVR